MKNLTNIKQKISYFIENQGIGITNFYKESGVTYGILAQKSNISEDNIVKFLTRYPEVNPDWLLTGNGDMLREATPQHPAPKHKPAVALPAPAPADLQPVLELTVYKELLIKKDKENSELHQKIGELTERLRTYEQQQYHQQCRNIA